MCQRWGLKEDAFPDRTVIANRSDIVTFHRAQGMTLEKVKVDLSRFWEKGHAYVALSRATASDGLWLEGNTSKLRQKTEADPAVLRFLHRTIWRNGGLRETRPHSEDAGSKLQVN